ncbi:alpha/beta fold hydrolase [Jatrophihabitans endophyticus]|uniref:alpha/beta fold hydrolase n=1 Tax=Jatrophihabitans endophyticus TaxID=1206085 RepID=UPI001A0892F9|nr:alpha/beta fold hydrolase [Jatrophihabitans endophyticus]MBE7189301.1 alpha/beta hydrolase [Jatrophihabitans endophyticus]
MTDAPQPATIDDVEHHTVRFDDVTLHYVSAGTSGPPILLVHGFPESWWAFRGVIPRLGVSHRVFAVDLRGFGDSTPAGDDYTSAVAADDLRRLVEHLDVGAVHVVGQDLGGPTVYRLAAEHPEVVRSVAAVETGLPGFGAEMLADVVHGGAWYIGALAAPGVADWLFAGRERQFLAEHLYPSYGLTAPELTAADTDEFVRTYARPHGLAGAIGLYRSLLADGEEIKALAAARPLGAPVLALGSSGGPFTADAFTAVSEVPVTAVQLDGVGHYVAQEAPDRFADTLAKFVADAASAAT